MYKQLYLDFLNTHMQIYIHTYIQIHIMDYIYINTYYIYTRSHFTHFFILNPVLFSGRNSILLNTKPGIGTVA